MTGIVESLVGLPIQFSETSDGIMLDFTMFRVFFSGGSQGYDKIYDRFGNVLVYDNRVVLERLFKAPDTWRQRGTPTGISWIKVNDHHYEVTRHHDDYLGTTYDVKYTVKSDSPLKITITLNSGKTDTYRIAWTPSGVVKTDWKKAGNRLVFGDEATEYGWVGFDWEDAYQSLGDITASSVETVAQGMKANIVFSVGTVNAGQSIVVDPSVVGTSTSVGATQVPFQRRTFYTNGRFWVFYGDGTNTGWRSSTDGTTWSSFTAIGAGLQGRRIAIYWDGTYVNYERSIPTNDYIYYRRGVPNSDGTITWDAERTVATGTVKDYGSVAKDSNGYPWVAYSYYVASYTPRIRQATALDGSAWGTDTELDATGGTIGPAALQLPSGKMYAIWCYYTPAEGSRELRGKLYNGSSWGVLATIDTNVKSYANWSAVVYGSTVYLVYTKGTTNNVVFRSWTEAGGWTSETTLESTDKDANTSVVIAINNDDLYVFWTYSTTIYLKRRLSGAWQTKESFVTDESNIVAGTLASSFKTDESKIGVVWTAGAASPYNVRFDFLAFPVAYTQTISELLGMLDSTAPRVNYKQALIELLGLLDSTTKIAHYHPVVGDILGLVDALPIPKGAFKKDIADTLGLLESAPLKTSYHVTLTDLLGLLESATARSALKQAISELLGMLDAVPIPKGAYKKSIIDILGILESVPLVTSYHVTVSDGLGLLDSSATTKTMRQTILDALGIVDSIIKKTELERTESITIEDLIEHLLAIFLELTETFVLVDTISKFCSIEQLETLSLTDLMAFIKTHIIELIEAIDIDDEVYKHIMMEKTESMVFLDFFEKFNGIILELVDEFSMADSIVKSSSRTLKETTSMRMFFHKIAHLFRQYVESMTMEDVIVKKTLLTPTETINTSDSAISFVVYKSLVETLNIPDTIKKELIRTYTESMTLDDAITHLFLKLFEENINLTDAIELHSFFDRILTEFITMHDIIRKGTSVQMTEMTNIIDMVIVLQVIQLLLREVLGVSDSISKKSIKILSESTTLVDLMTIQKLLTIIIKIMDKYPVIERQTLTAILDEIDRDGTLNTEEKTLTTRVVQKLFDLPLQSAEKTLEEIKRTLGVSTEKRETENVVDIKQEITVNREPLSATVTRRSDTAAIVNIDYKKTKKRPGET